MIQQTVFPFKIETTKERLTAHGGLALMAEFNHGIGLRELTDRYLPPPGSHRGFEPSVMGDSLVLMLQGGGRSLEDLRELKNAEGLLKMIGRDEIGEGNVSPQSGHKEFYLECKKRMPVGKRIGNYRADSASYQAGLFNQLEQDGVKYGMTADQDKAVKALIGLIKEGEWKEPVMGCGYELAETVHCMNETKKAFRLVIKREIRRQGELFEVKGAPYFYHAVATN